MELATVGAATDVAPMVTAPRNSLSPGIRAEMSPERIGYRLTLLREAIGLSKAEMADMLGIERTYWYRFEGGKRPISDAVGALLAERFGVTLDFLVLGRWDRLPLELAQRMRDVERGKAAPQGHRD